MNTPNPISPDRSLTEQKTKSRMRVRLAIITVLALHVVVLVPLLVQGCKRQEEIPPPATETALPPVAEETNLPPTEMMHTNVMPMPLVPPTNVMTSVAPSPAPAPAPAEGTTYTVVKGDSFFSIGKKFGVSIKAISEANPGVDSSHLKIGQKLNVPPAAAAHEAGMSAGAMEATTGEAVYVVKSGDTLMKIARQHGTSYKAIKAANGVGSPGTELEFAL